MEFPAPDSDADLRVILGRFGDARCVLECAVRSLEQWRDLDEPVCADRRRTDDAEVVCLRHGLKLLAAVYDELDAAIMLRVVSEAAGSDTRALTRE